MIKLFAVLGFVVVLLGILGSLGVGNFVLIYSPHKITTTIHKPIEK